jgi:ammonia channel protein AmtB
MPDPLEPLHPQDKRAWLYGDPVAIDDQEVAFQVGCAYGTVEALDFAGGFVHIASRRRVFVVAFAFVRRITDEDTGRYSCDLFEWGGV